MIRLYAYAACLSIVAAGYFWWSHHVSQQAVAQEQARVEHQADLQRTANRSRSDEAEERQSAQTITRDRYITKTLTEIRYVTQNLSACVLTPDAIGMLNATAKCATENRSASCAVGDKVRPAN